MQMVMEIRARGKIWGFIIFFGVLLQAAEINKEIESERKFLERSSSSLVSAEVRRKPAKNDCKSIEVGTG